MRERERDSIKMQLMESLYGKFYKQLYIYALSFLSDEDDAVDIVSDFFSDLWQQWQYADDITPPPSNYLYTSIRNRCLDRLRHDQVHRNYALLAETRETLDNTDEVEAYERKLSELGHIIEGLPEPKRSIMTCCYFKRLTYKQTAEQLGLSVSSVKKHIMRVFKMLRQSLKNNKEFKD